MLSPLLTADAVELLLNCLTSKENELWHSLGDVWYVPQEDWNDHVPSYRPVFTDGGGGGPPTHQAQGNNYNSNGNSAYDRHHQEPPEQGNKDSTHL